MTQTAQPIRYYTNGKETPEGSEKTFFAGKDQFYSDDKLYIDCGGGAGIFALTCASRMKGVKVLAYEGYHVSFSYLTRNIVENSLFSVIADDHHILGENGRKSVSVSEGVVNLLGIGERRVVETRKIDSITAPEPGLIKITVPGAALEILKGAVETLKLSAPSIIVEIVSPKEEGQVLSFLESFGYMETESAPYRTIGATETKLMFLRIN